MGPELISLSPCVDNAGEVLTGWSSAAPQMGLGCQLLLFRSPVSPLPLPSSISTYVEPKVSIDVLISARDVLISFLLHTLAAQSGNQSMWLTAAPPGSGPQRTL